MTRASFAIAAATCVAVSLFILGAASTVAAKGRNHHGHYQAQVRLPSGFLGLLSGPTPFDPTDATRIAGTGVKNVRIGLPWLLVQRQPGPFVWAGSDRLIGVLAANGLHILP